MKLFHVYHLSGGGYDTKSLTPANIAQFVYSNNFVILSQDEYNSLEQIIPNIFYCITE